MSWGRKPTCECGACPKCKHREYMRQWYATKTREERIAMREQRDPERVRRQDLDRHYRMKGDPLYERRRRAVGVLNRAIRSGRIERGCCEVCGDPDTHGHHDDYDLPLDVRWLCPQHHADEHAKETV